MAAEQGALPLTRASAGRGAKKGGARRPGTPRTDPESPPRPGPRHSPRPGRGPGRVGSGARGWCRARARDLLSLSSLRRWGRFPFERKGSQRRQRCRAQPRDTPKRGIRRLVWHGPGGEGVEGVRVGRGAARAPHSPVAPGWHFPSPLTWLPTAPLALRGLRHQVGRGGGVGRLSGQAGLAAGHDWGVERRERRETELAEVRRGRGESEEGRNPLASLTRLSPRAGALHSTHSPSLAAQPPADCALLLARTPSAPSPVPRGASADTQFLFSFRRQFRF